MRSLMDCNPTHYCAADTIDKNEIGEVCSEYEEWKRSVQGFGGKPRGKEATW
jgi:hypothetical protein